MLGGVGALTAPAPHAFADLTDEEWAVAQERMDYWADQITGDLDSNEVASLPWFADMQYDVPSHLVTIYTKSSTNKVSSTIISGAAADGVTITEVHREKGSAQTLVDT